VDLGDSIQLEAVGSLDVAEMVWDSPIPLSCYDCLSPYITPTLDSVTIAVQLFSEDGCTNRDEITVYVKKNRLVYIPNAFSPNGNRRNDFFSVFTGKGVSAIRFLRVYNRWGGQIYESKNLTLGDKRNGWDGLQENEEPALPGVYVYVVEVEFLDGEVRQYRGDFTLFK
jgi:gliding motility-associated-like protein